MPERVRAPLRACDAVSVGEDRRAGHGAARSHRRAREEGGERQLGRGGTRSQYLLHPLLDLNRDGYFVQNLLKLNNVTKVQIEVVNKELCR